MRAIINEIQIVVMFEMEEIIDHTENVEEGNEFYFESDQLALRNNSDYAAVLKALIILESQRKQALKDLDTLSLLEKQALENPIEFVKNISNLENLPTQLKIAEVFYKNTYFFVIFINLQHSFLFRFQMLISENMISPYLIFIQIINRK